MNKSLVGIGAVTLVAASLLGCAGGNVDWFGNPEPSPDKGCATGHVLQTPDTTDENKIANEYGGWGRDPRIPEGYKWIVIRLDVAGIQRHEDATGTDIVSNRYCLPVDVHLEVDTPELDTWMSNGPTNDVFITATPWLGRVTLAYDPNAEGFRERAPRYHIRVTATYRPDLDVADLVTATPEQRDPATNLGEPVGLGCRMGLPSEQPYARNAGLSEASLAHAYALFPAQDTVVCDYEGNVFNN